ncbi:MAG: hypothetical protein U5K37_01100 [Natrialbaceae archaeon]|nr:hypothetical protein [Natrialbaceae archaeon]
MTDAFDPVVTAHDRGLLSVEGCRGSNDPTYRNAIRGLEEEWAPMRRALRQPYQADFDRLFDRARGFADAAGQANSPDPERALLLSLLLAHEVEIRQLHERLEG